MAFNAGARIGPYDVVAPLGAGGMGEVYRARDGRLGRDVAVKTLPASFSKDADRLRRFELEARASGVLNHPNILAVYDIGSHDGAPYVVSELLEGETLRDRIGSTALPVRKAVDYAGQIARGLAAAHEKGIVHRDLKPENIFVTRDGRVKILDFGLAKLTHADAEPEAETIDRAPGTDAGAVLGTVGYMSPEQVRAKPVDHRSDIFSFGAVFYEMLSGARAFRGNSAVETMNAILKEDPPPLSATSRVLPPALERIVGHCLEKNPEERFQSARDIAFDLEQLSGSSTTTAAIAGGPSRKWVPWAAGALLVAAGLAGAYRIGQARAEHPVVTFRPVTFQNGLVTDARFGSDGKQIYYQAAWPGAEPDVYVTQPGTPESRGLRIGAQRLHGISRGGDMLILHGESVLAQVPTGGGAPRDLVTGVAFADWSPDGSSIAVLRFSRGRQQLEYPLGKTLHESVSMRFPRVSPDGRYVAFSDHPFVGDFRGDIAMVDLTGAKKTLSANWADIRGLAWSPDGREVWFTGTRAGSESSLWAVTLDGHERLVFRAPGSLALHDVMAGGRALMSVQRRRPVTFVLAPGDTKEKDLSWMDYGVVSTLSADGRQLLFSEQGEAGGAEYATYIRSTDGALPVRLGKGSAFDLSPDGATALVVDLNLPMQLMLLPTGAGTPRALPRGPLVQMQGGFFLPDRKRVVIQGNEPGKSPRLYVQDLASGDPKPVSDADTTVSIYGLTVSADGADVAASSPDRVLRLYPIAGGPPRDVPGALPGDIAIRFTPDGRSLFVSPIDDGGNIAVIDLAKGTRSPWKRLARDTGNPAAQIVFVALSADGKSYAYSFRDDTSTLYVAEGLR